MAVIALKDILINARQESHRMRHFYLGVEHLFVALLEIQGGLASSILEEQGVTPEYVIDAVRRKIGKGGKRRLWAGIPNSPRADVVMSIANDIALEEGRRDINERDLLTAILDENDSIPTRVLRGLGLDMQKLSHAARTHTLNNQSQRPYVGIDFGPDYERDYALTRDERFILQRMFNNYSQIRIERRLTGGHTQALVLVATPIHADGREDSPVVVKIDHTDNILDEAQRYETHVKGTLPPLTARLEDAPTAPEISELAGVKYTFLTADAGDNAPQDLLAAARDLAADRLGNWLRTELFPFFGKTWWQQRRPYRFQMWQEYDWLLPPVLTLELLAGDEIPPGAHVLSIPISRARLREIEFGDLVSLENFVVQRVDREANSMRLAIGHGTEAAKRAYKVDMRGLNLDAEMHFRGETIERISGRVWKTRHEILLHTVRSLEPDFDVRYEELNINTGAIEKLPNPLLNYDDLLDRRINGSLSKIHGDLHLGNILIGPNNSAGLIDFAQARDGHTLFDWAMLEISLLSEVVMPIAGESWDVARLVLRYVDGLNNQQDVATVEGSASIAAAMASVAAVREIAHTCLADPSDWTEYYAALAMCALRAITWDTMSIGGRRLQFLVTALAISEVKRGHRTSSDEFSPDATDLRDPDSAPPSQ